VKRPIRLTSDHDTSMFDSGDDALDDWLRRHALVNQAGRTANTFVVLGGEGQVVGYYCLATGVVERASATARAARGAPNPVPGILIGRLAVDSKHQGRGLGAALLRDAILRTLTVGRTVGVRVLFAHAINDEARAFYRHFDFDVSPVDPLLVMLMLKDVRGHGTDDR
jgi:GNAT superfamily N-acetyltransferase